MFFSSDSLLRFASYICRDIEISHIIIFGGGRKWADRKQKITTIMTKLRLVKWFYVHVYRKSR